MSVPIYFCQIRDEKRTILVHVQHEEIIREIWKHEAGEDAGEPPPITRPPSVDPNLMRQAKEFEYKAVKYWVIEKLSD
jgi:hypothetical protein